MSAALKALMRGGGSSSDPQFSKNVLLIHADGTNGAQNNTFIDSSSNNFSITRNGNATQGTFSPFSKEEGKWGCYFDGSGDYLSLADNTAFELGSSDFTIEAWIFPTVSGASQGIFGNWRTDNTTRGYELYIHSDNKCYFIVEPLGNVSAGSSQTVNFNAWNHVVAARSGTTMCVWVNGVRGATQAVSGSISDVANSFLIGAYVNSSGYFNGSISNVRLVKGTDVYGVSNSTITVPTAPLTAITNTSLLCCQSNRFKDNSSNAFTVTPAGDARIIPFSPFANSAAYSASVNGGSGYFDGATDSLQAPSGASVSGTGDFTLEFYVYISSIGISYVCPVANDTQYGLSTLINSSGTVSFGRSLWSIEGTTSNAIQFGAWNHIAFCRASGTMRMFINGVKGYDAANSLNFISGVVRIGTDGGGTAWMMNGYMSCLRSSNTALYTANFTPPTAPFTQSGALLLNFTNAAIYDQTGTCDLETVGNAQISTSVKKYGTGAMSFDGTGDGIQFGPSDSLVLGTGDFTVEFWMYMNAQTGTYDSLVDTRWSSGTGFAINSYNNSINYYNGVYQLSRPRSLNTWHHVALVRSNGVSKLYVDGDAGAGTYSDTINYNTTVWQIGRYYGPSDYLNGYIDDLRISRYARYTGTFTPPAAPFEDK